MFPSAVCNATIQETAGVSRGNLSVNRTNLMMLASRQAPQLLTSDGVKSSSADTLIPHSCLSISVLFVAALTDCGRYKINCTYPCSRGEIVSAYVWCVLKDFLITGSHLSLKPPWRSGTGGTLYPLPALVVFLSSFFRESVLSVPVTLTSSFVWFVRLIRSVRWSLV